MTKSIDLW